MRHKDLDYNDPIVENANFVQKGAFWGSHYHENGWKTSENISVKRIYDANRLKARRLGARAKNPTWPSSAWFGHTNFFSMGDNAKILFSIMMFSYPDKKNLTSQGSPGPFGSF